MNSIEDRISAATRAAADTVRPDTIPPLRLPADGQARSRPGRSWARLLAPAAAAIAVVVLVVAVVVVSRHMHRAATPANSPVASYVASGQVPPYFVALAATGAANRSPANAEVHATADGRRLATVNPSAPDGTIGAVTGAADDRTFVLAEQPWAQQGVQQYQPRSFYLLRLGSAGQVSSLTKLPISVPADNTLRGLALSPDGRRLAVAVQPGAVAMPCRLTVYTLGSGAARTWSAPRSSAGSIGLAPDDARAAVLDRGRAHAGVRLARQRHDAGRAAAQRRLGRRRSAGGQPPGGLLGPVRAAGDAGASGRDRYRAVQATG
jgi:hypothetical protein